MQPNQALSAFHLCSKLPAEPRILIWELVTEPLVLKLHNRNLYSSRHKTIILKPLTPAPAITRHAANHANTAATAKPLPAAMTIQKHAPGRTSKLVSPTSTHLPLRPSSNVEENVDGRVHEETLAERLEAVKRLRMLLPRLPLYDV